MGWMVVSLVSTNRDFGIKEIKYVAASLLGARNMEHRRFQERVGVCDGLKEIFKEQAK